MTIQVTFDCSDPEALSRFWAQTLGYVIPGPPDAELPPGADPFEAWHVFLRENRVPEHTWNDSSAAVDPTGIGPRLYFQRVPEGKVVKNRVHLDLRGAPGLSGEARMAALEAECERLVALGASRLRRFEANPPLESGFIVMQDPEGNEFCLD